MREEAASQKKKKHPSKPEADSLKPKAIKWEKKLQVEKQEKSIKERTPTALNQSQ